MKAFADYLVLCFACCALVGCAKTRQAPGQSSETHFLATCASDDCGEGLNCVCGVCTEACEQSSSCSEHGARAQCERTGLATCDSAAMVCDVTCESNADCESVGSTHTCEAGRCRAPRVGVAGDGDGDVQDAGARAIASCDSDDVMAYLLADQELAECGAGDGDAGLGAQDQARCVTMALSARQPFYASWHPAGIDSFLTSGYFARYEAGDYRVYSFHADTLGTSRLNATWHASWAPCARFAVDETCTELEACFSCIEDEAKLCGCQLDNDGDAQLACAELDTPPCEVGSCLVDDACVPHGWASDDGCCGCDDGNLSCIEPAGCPAGITIGRRCANDAQCQQRGVESALQCRTDFAGERGVCTRPCGFGCPSGTECVAQVPHYDEGFVTDMCMVPCETHEHCVEAIGVENRPSECDAPGDLSESYCF